MSDAIIGECRNVLPPSEWSTFIMALSAGAQAQISYDNAKMLAVRIVARRNTVLAKRVEEFITQGEVASKMTVPWQHLVCQQGVVKRFPNPSHCPAGVPPGDRLVFHE